MTHRIVVGARGLLGHALVTHLASLPGRLLAVDAAPEPQPDPLAGVWVGGVPVATVDCRDREFVEMTHEFVQGAGRVELYQAAGAVGRRARIKETSLDMFRAVMEGNLLTCYAAMRAVAETARVEGATGSLTVIGSVGASKAHRYQIAYDAAKAGVESLARGFALEYGPHGISTRVVAIGPVAESASTAADGPLRQALVDLVPLGRYPAVAEIAYAIAVVGSPTFDPANGETISLDGGLSKQLRPASVERPPDG
jgi:gluconate 5-dehydrogenase